MTTCLPVVVRRRSVPSRSPAFALPCLSHDRGASRPCRGDLRLVAGNRQRLDAPVPAGHALPKPLGRGATS